MKTGLALLSILVVTFKFFPSDEARSVNASESKLLCESSSSSILFSIEKFQSEDMDQCMLFFDKSSDIALLTAINQDSFLDYARLSERYIIFVCKKCEILDKKVVGFLLADKTANRASQRLLVRALGIDSDYRRLGLATKLLEQAEDFARKNNYQGMSLYASNDGAKSCYERFGFSIDEKSYSDKNLIKKFN
jgi:ribosomal protein S18 acetylase RimI-like enzyme